MPNRSSEDAQAMLDTAAGIDAMRARAAAAALDAVRAQDTAQALDAAIDALRAQAQAMDAGGKPMQARAAYKTARRLRDAGAVALDAMRAQMRMRSNG